MRHRGDDGFEHQAWFIFCSVLGGVVGVVLTAVKFFDPSTEYSWMLATAPFWVGPLMGLGGVCVLEVLLDL